MKSGCLLCNNSSLVDILDLKKQPLPSVLKTQIDIERFPLQLVLCQECFSLQISETVEAKNIFPEDFSYFSSYSDTIIQHSKSLADKLISLKHLDKNSTILELGCNDGVLLREIARSNANLIGIEPSPKPAGAASEKGFNIYNEFFSSHLAEKLLSQIRKQDLIVSNNVFAHCDNLNDIFTGINLLLKQDGLLVFEIHYVRSIVEKYQFDTIYHEHIFYHSITSLNILLDKHGFKILDIEDIAAQGGSIRIFADKKTNDTHKQLLNAECLTRYLVEEEKIGIKKADYYLRIKPVIQQCTSSLNKFIETEISKGKTFCAYGAAAKGTMLINHCGLDSSTIHYVVEKNNFKIGKFIPGTDIPVKKVQTLYDDPCDYCLILPWNIHEEITKQEKTFIENGSKFFIAIPEVKLL